MTAWSSTPQPTSSTSEDCAQDYEAAASQRTTDAGARDNVQDAIASAVNVVTFNLTVRG